MPAGRAAVPTRGSVPISVINGMLHSGLQTLGDAVGVCDGDIVGESEGEYVVGSALGVCDGVCDGAPVGEFVSTAGDADGAREGVCDGESDGVFEGEFDGENVASASVGDDDG